MMTDEQLLFAAMTAADEARSLCAGAWTAGGMDRPDAEKLMQSARRLSCAATELCNRACGQKPARVGD